MNLIDVIKNAGVVGAGGAGFPTHLKLNAKADWFIVNAAECEPLIETDKYLCRVYADKIIAAAEIVAEHLGAKHIVIVTKQSYKPEITALRAAISKADSRTELFLSGVFYPAGDEQIIVQMVTGKSVPERGIPLAVGAVVDNVGTLCSIYDAVIEGKSVYTKYLSIVGAVEHPMMVHTPIGTSLTECIEQASPNMEDFAVILGGPMMGRMLSDKNEIKHAVVTKTLGNILVLPKVHYLVTRSARSIERIKMQTRSACIQCRMCTDLCPRYMIGHSIKPHLIMRNLYREETITDDAEFLRTYGDAANCCACGACEMFSCPMGLSPRKVNDYMKQRLRARGLQPEPNKTPEARCGINMRRIPTGRLVARLGFAEYYHRPIPAEVMEIHPKKIFVPFSQHIGRPAAAVKTTGDFIRAGELLAAAADGVSANIHAGISGFITEISAAGAVIEVRGEE